MTTPHTLQSLLPLLDTPEGLEKLRILTAEADGWKYVRASTYIDKRPVYAAPESGCLTTELPNYPASLDAIFAAEERLGLHDPKNGVMRQHWYIAASEVIEHLELEHSTEDFAFLTAAQRCIPFILTAQEVRPV